MSVQVSTGFKTLILGPNSFESVFNQGRVLIYSGAQPANADAAAQGTYIGQITLNGAVWAPFGSDGGLIFARAGVWVSKPVASAWQLVAAVTGVAGWFRLVGPAPDTGDLSNSAPRIDGTIGTGGAVELVLSSPSQTAGMSTAVQQFTYTIPPVL